MNFDEYQRDGALLYRRLAETVAAILDVVVRGSPELRVQQIQHRAKAPESLRTKLEERGMLDAPDIGVAVKDLAGCRIVLYTNDDVDRLVRSQAILDSFDVDWDRTKFHYPLDTERDDQLFISFNYVVKLNEKRTSLPEYAELDGLWCEIQVQTTLNHAWSEMSHDTAYKAPRSGFGTAALADVNARLAKIMREHLLPAGYDFQKVSDDVHRLNAARVLYDQNPMQGIRTAADNNERHALIGAFDDEVLEFLDDIATETPAIRAAVVEAIFTSRITETVPLSYPGFELPGKTRTDVLNRSLGLLDKLRYFAAPEGFCLLCEIAAGAEPGEEMKRLRQSSEAVAKHELRIWEKYGPVVQRDLVDWIAANPPRPPQARVLVVEALSAVLRPSVTGHSSTSSSVTFIESAVVPNDGFIAIRNLALDQLEAMFSSAEDDVERRSIIQAMRAASDRPRQTNYSNDLLTATLADAARTVRFLTSKADSLSFDLRRSVEHNMITLYRRHSSLPDDMMKIADIVAKNDALLLSLEAFRDAVDTDPDYAIHKTLVGYEEVQRSDWDRPTSDYKVRNQARSTAVMAMVASVTDDALDRWSELILRALSTDETDGARFVGLREFLETLGREKPAFALRLIDRDEPRLSTVLDSLLRGLISSAPVEERSLVEQWIAQGRHLATVMAYCTWRKPFDPQLLEACTTAAITAGDETAIALAIDAASRRGAEAPQLLQSVLLPSVRALKAQGNHLWTRQTWFAWDIAFATRLGDSDADELLAYMIPIPNLDHHEEWMLAALAKRWPAKVLALFGDRIANGRAKANGESYDPIPYDMDHIREAYAASADQVVEAVRSWFVEPDPVFQFSGGRFISRMFPDLGPAEAPLRRLVERGEDGDIQFVLHVLLAYEGESFVHELCRAIVEASPPDSDAWTRVGMVVDSTGVMVGDFGMVEAVQARRTLLEPWLADPREKVRAFAEDHIRGMDRQIAAEQRRAIEDLNLRKRQFGEA